MLQRAIVFEMPNYCNCDSTRLPIYVNDVNSTSCLQDISPFKLQLLLWYYIQLPIYVNVTEVNSPSDFREYRIVNFVSFEQIYQVLPQYHSHKSSSCSDSTLNRLNTAKPESLFYSCRRRENKCFCSVESVFLIIMIKLYRIFSYLKLARSPEINQVINITVTLYQVLRKV